MYGIKKAKIENIPSREDFINGKCKEDMFFPIDTFEESRKGKIYIFYMIGILTNGEKVCLKITDIFPYFYVKLDNITIDDIKEVIDNYIRIEKVKRKEYLGFNKKGYFAKIIYDKIGNCYTKEERSNDIILCRKAGFKIFKEKTTNYFRHVLREYDISASSWINIEKAKKVNDDISKLPVYEISINDVSKISIDEILKTPELRTEKTIMMGWDIETYSSTDKFTSPSIDTDEVFVIGCVFFFKGDKKPFLRVCLSKYKINEDPDYYTLVCKTEKKLISSFFLLLERMNPDYILGYNDSSFDWPWIIERAHRVHNLLPMIDNISSINKKFSWKMEEKMSFEEWVIKEKRSYYHNNKDVYDTSFSYGNYISYIYKPYLKNVVKISDGIHIDIHTIHVPGILPIDVMTCMKKIYVNEQSHILNAMLKKCNLPLKDDMNIGRMFKIYENAKSGNLDKEDMRLVCHYCVYDAEACILLTNKEEIVSNFHDIATLSYMEMMNSIYQAGGSRIIQYIKEVGNKLGYVYNDAPKYSKDGKFQGAYVLEPKTGLRKPKRTIRELGIPIEYCEIIENKMIECDSYKYDDIKDILSDIPEEYHEILIENLKEEVKLPVGALDFSSLYPSLIMTYNLSPEKMITASTHTADEIEKYIEKYPTFNIQNEVFKCYVVKHNNDLCWSDDKIDDSLGIFQRGLLKLYKLRLKYKKYMKYYGKILETSKGEIIARFDDSDLFQGESMNREDIDFLHKFYNRKQLNVKILMNTLYGQCGNDKCLFYMPELCNSITYMGRESIIMAKNAVDKMKADIIYGDTDSLYLSPPYKHYHNLCLKYYSNQIDKEEFLNKIITKSMRLLGKMQKKVNKKFYNDNKSYYLKMAYEEILYPVAFLGKKKYFGCAHENIPSYISDPNKVFTRGIQVKKRNTAKIAVQLYNDIILKNVIDLNNFNTLEELAYKLIDDYFTKDFENELFAQSIMYKPFSESDSTTAMRTYIRRKKNEGISILPFYRYNMVVVERMDWEYNIKGNQKKLTMGDKFERIEDVDKYNMIVDKKYMMEKSIMNILARLLSYKDETEYKNIEWKDEDKMRILYGKKLVQEYINNKNYIKKYVNVGIIYKKIYSTIFSLIKETKYLAVLGNDAVLLQLDKVKASSNTSLGIKPGKEVFHCKKILDHFEILYMNLEIKLKETNEIDIASIVDYYRNQLKNQYPDLFSPVYDGGYYLDLIKHIAKNYSINKNDLYGMLDSLEVDSNRITIVKDMILCKRIINRYKTIIKNKKVNIDSKDMVNDIYRQMKK